MSATETPSAAGHYIETDKVAMGVWKRLTASFSISRLLLESVFGMRSVWPFRKDNLGQMLQTDRWKIGLGLLGGLDDHQVDFLVRYAAINERRVDHVFRATALFLVSIPVGSLIAVNEIVPDAFAVTGIDFLFTLIGIIGAWAIVAGVMFAASWRARDLHDLVSFEQARRGLENAKVDAP